MKRLSLLIWCSLLLTATSAGAFVDDVDEHGQPRTAVIFSASFGGGHDSSAEAIKAELLKRYPRLNVVILYGQNYLPLAGHFPGVGNASTFLFNMVYQIAPGYYDRVYDKTIATADDKASAGDIPNPFFSHRRVLADLKRLKPDVIYSTYHILTSKLIWLREHGHLNPDIPIAWLDTDFVQKRFYWLHSLGVDQTFIAHPALRDERLELGVPAAKMATTGLFINPFVFEEFSDDQRRTFMREALSIPDQAAKPAGIWINGRVQPTDRPEITLDPDVTTITIASGRAGVGDYAVIIEGLVREARARGLGKIQIVAVCGDNKKNFAAVTALYERLARRGEAGGVTIVASHLVDNMKLMKLVRSSALFIGKSGSQSPFEAAVMGVPRVLIDVIGGQERWTANFFRRLGLAEVVAAHEQHTLAARAFAYIEDEARMARRREADQVIRESYDLSPIPDFFARAIEMRAAKPPVVPPKRERVAVCAGLFR